jgi:hypothetical protein
MQLGVESKELWNFLNNAREKLQGLAHDFHVARSNLIMYN